MVGIIPVPANHAGCINQPDRTILVKRDIRHLASILRDHYTVLIEVIHLAVLDTIGSCAETSFGIAVAFGLMSVVSLIANLEPSAHLLAIFLDVDVALPVTADHDCVFGFGIGVNVRMNADQNSCDCHYCENLYNPLFHCCFLSRTFAINLVDFLALLQSIPSVLFSPF